MLWLEFIRHTGRNIKKVNNRVQLKWVIDAYKLFPGKDSFFLTSHFNRLAGNDILIQQIKDGKSEEEIRQSWKPDLKKFKAIRKKYLLYDDLNKLLINNH
jgi:uncharacterized protein YbbC (DUF1343 family)